MLLYDLHSGLRGSNANHIQCLWAYLFATQSKYFYVVGLNPATAGINQRTLIIRGSMSCTEQENVLYLYFEAATES